MASAGSNPLRPIDGADGRVRIGIGGQERPAGSGHERPGFRQKRHTVEAGHPLIGQYERQRLGGRAFPRKHVHGFLPARRPNDAIIAPITSEQVPADSPENLRFVVDRHDQRFTHPRNCDHS